MSQNPKRKLLLIGHLALNTDHIGGQTIKSRNVYFALLNKGYDVKLFDTHILKFKKANIIKLLYQIFLHKKIIIIPAQNNIKLLAPYIYILKILLNKSIYMIAVGGWLEEFIRNRILYKYILKNYEVILLQNNTLTQKLRKEHSFANVETLHNFKVHDFQPNIQFKNISILKVVFLGRIIPEKGVDLILDLCNIIDCKSKKNWISIDFIGPVAEDYKERFESRISEFAFASNKGPVSPDELYPILSKYDVMLFPTKYDGEGFPGVVLDAFNVGIPVISTYWKDIPDIIVDEFNGFLVEVDDKFTIYDKLLRLQKDATLLYTLKLNSLESSKYYSEESGVKILQSFLEV